MLKISDCISYIQKIEEAYPDWTASTILDGLRHDTYDSDFFQKMLSTGASKKIESKGNLEKKQINDLYESIRHGSDRNNPYIEAGISQDPSTGRMVAFGHVIVGIAAGVRHPLNLSSDLNDGFAKLQALTNIKITKMLEMALQSLHEFIKDIIILKSNI